MGSQRTIPIDQVVVQYWFDGPDDSLDPRATLESAEAAANDTSAAGAAPPAVQQEFKLFCSDASSQLRKPCSPTPCLGGNMQGGV